MNIKFYLKLLTSVFMLTSLCYAGSLLDTITANHTSRKDMFNRDYGANKGEINARTNTINKIFSEEGNVEKIFSTATTDEKKKIASAIMAAAWTDAINRRMKDNRTAKNPYALNTDGSLKVENKNLYNHYLIIHLLDQLARDVVVLLVSTPAARFNATINLGRYGSEYDRLCAFYGCDNATTDPINPMIDIYHSYQLASDVFGRFVSTPAGIFEETIDLGAHDSKYSRLYAFDGFDKDTVVGWLNSVRKEHQDGLACVCGDNYYFGRNGVVQSYENAVPYFQIAADGNSAAGQCSLGYMYDHGLGVTEDKVEAVKWWRLAADQEHADAQNNLAGTYYKGVALDLTGIRYQNVPENDEYYLAIKRGRAKAKESDRHNKS